MRILHTSDWHIGHTINDYDRQAEHEEVFRQIVEVARRHEPDAMVISGDIFHTSQPSAAAQRQLTDTLVALRDACPSMPIFSIAGNHDSGSKHDIFRRPWKMLGIHTFGSIDKERPDSHIAELPGKGFVVAVPYAHQRNMPDDFFRRLLELTESRNRAGLPVVLMAHTTVAGCDFNGHDNGTELTVGGIDSMALEEFGTGFDYLALGHIHRPQTLSGSAHRARYCGSPLAVDFSETYAHSVSIVTIEAHGSAPIITVEEIENPRPLVTLPSKGFADWPTAAKLLEEFPADMDAYVRLNVEIDGSFPPDAGMLAETACRTKAAKFCRLNCRRPEQAEAQCTAMTVDELRDMPPMELARRFAADTGQIFTDDMARMLAEAIDAVDEDSRID